MKTYREHHCDRTHKTYAAFARCVWGSRSRVEGDGAYAVVHRLRVGRMPAYTEVLLFATEDEAAETYRLMSGELYCGGSCRNAGGRHDLITLDLVKQERR